MLSLINYARLKPHMVDVDEAELVLIIIGIALAILIARLLLPYAIIAAEIALAAVAALIALDFLSVYYNSSWAAEMPQILLFFGALFAVCLLVTGIFYLVGGVLVDILSTIVEIARNLALMA
jgi:hypothetical protein